jgi:hypothetical protein
MNTVAAGFRANVNHGIADALGLGQKNLFFSRNAQGQCIHQRVLRVARLKRNFAADCRHAKAISVVANSADYAIENAAVGRKWRVASGE